MNSFHEVFLCFVMGRFHLFQPAGLWGVRFLKAGNLFFEGGNFHCIFIGWVNVGVYSGRN